MARRRLGVALVFDPPLADEIDGLRRALGDRVLTRVMPHLTLVSPINVRPTDLPAVLALIRDAAATAPGPLRLDLGPPATFLPANPVVYLAVGGADVEALARLRTIVFAGPLARTATWPWVPHVTLADDMDATRIAPATSVLDGYRVTTTCDRVVLLEQGPPPLRRWRPLADAVLGPRTIIGRGGLELELTGGRVVDPEAEDLLRRLPAARDITASNAAEPPEASHTSRRPDAPGLLGAGPAPLPVVCTARREGQVVGVGAAWQQGRRGYLGVAVDPGCRGQGIGSQLLGRIDAVLAEAGWDGPGLRSVGPPGFYRARTSLLAD